MLYSLQRQQSEHCLFEFAEVIGRSLGLSQLGDASLKIVEAWTPDAAEILVCVESLLDSQSRPAGGIDGLDHCRFKPGEVPLQRKHHFADFRKRRLITLRFL